MPVRLVLGVSGAQSTDWCLALGCPAHKSTRRRVPGRVAIVEKSSIGPYPWRFLVTAYRAVEATKPELLDACTKRTLLPQARVPPSALPLAPGDRGCDTTCDDVLTSDRLLRRACHARYKRTHRHTPVTRVRQERSAFMDHNASWRTPRHPRARPSVVRAQSVRTHVHCMCRPANPDTDASTFPYTTRAGCACRVPPVVYSVCACHPRHARCLWLCHSLHARDAL